MFKTPFLGTPLAPVKASVARREAGPSSRGGASAEAFFFPGQTKLLSNRIIIRIDINVYKYLNHDLLIIRITLLSIVFKHTPVATAPKRLRGQAARAGWEASAPSLTPDASDP